MATAASRTGFEALYRDTYWGKYATTNITDDIVCNRNVFASTLNLKECTVDVCRETLGAATEGLVGMEIDHMESYVAGDGAVFVVVSPYSAVAADEQRMRDLGWTPWSPLYSDDARTYVLRLPASEDEDEWLRRWDGTGAVPYRSESSVLL